MNRSDYGPFRSRSIPFLFFTTGENPRYHKPDDTAETLNYPKLTAISQMIDQVVAKAADAPAVPRWQKNPDNPFAEAVTIRDVLRLLVKNSEQLKIGGPSSSSSTTRWPRSRASSSAARSRPTNAPA